MLIKIVTYMRASENLNEGLLSIIHLLQSMGILKEIIIFTDADRTFETDNDILIKSINYPGTKYIRLRKAIDEEVDECLFISVDNDMIFDEKTITYYIQECLQKNVDISWARIQAQTKKSFISNLIVVDKLLSHEIIRPLLWKFHVGLTIPGQCFVINPLTFKHKLWKLDTFLDDLALGAYVSEHFQELNIFISSQIIGYEYPKETFMGLCRQRKRWAKGYYQVLKHAVGKPYYPKLLIHGASYHFNWIINWSIIICLFKRRKSLSCIWISFLSYTMTKKNHKYFFWGIIYQLIFPVFHIVWFINLLKGEKNNDNG